MLVCCLQSLKPMTDLLKAEGYFILTSKEAEEAQDRLITTLPNFILIGNADGIALTGLIDSNARTNHINIVPLTSFAINGDDQKAKKAGCDGNVAKPIPPRQLPTIISC
jgi:two-component system cell cycle response regulator DivK